MGSTLLKVFLKCINYHYTIDNCISIYVKILFKFMLLSYFSQLRFSTYFPYFKLSLSTYDKCINCISVSSKQDIPSFSQQRNAKVVFDEAQMLELVKFFSGFLIRLQLKQKLCTILTRVTFTTCVLMCRTRDHTWVSEQPAIKLRLLLGLFVNTENVNVSLIVQLK